MAYATYTIDFYYRLVTSNSDLVQHKIALESVNSLFWNNGLLIGAIKWSNTKREDTRRLRLVAAD